MLKLNIKVLVMDFYAKVNYLKQNAIASLPTHLNYWLIWKILQEIIQFYLKNINVITCIISYTYGQHIKNLGTFNFMDISIIGLSDVSRSSAIYLLDMSYSTMPSITGKV